MISTVYFICTFLNDLAENERNWITANIKLPKAMVPNELVLALVNAFFQGTKVGDASFLWKYHCAVIEDNANLIHTQS